MFFWTFGGVVIVRSSILTAAMAWVTLITRSPAQESACKDLRRSGQSAVITPQAA
ncbi:hypothetical protein [Lacticaseibacillus rhamnosus]|uniref:hypothetical protein n=1 Tax=Lacticaseibacillus rhamnosus TaxID=47715 RepID=UPI001CDC5321|nr:hypothetical protein [Lacticaseibacillus rhamnosus]